MFKPGDRPCAQDALNHEYFKELDDTDDDETDSGSASPPVSSGSSTTPPRLHDTSGCDADEGQHTVGAAALTPTLTPALTPGLSR